MRLIAAVIAAIVAPSLMASGASVSGPGSVSTGTGKEKVRMVYDVDFEMNFDNREYDASAFSSSRTIFAARLTPSVGLSFRERGGGSHRLMVGIDVMKDFGASPVPEDIAGTGNTDETSVRMNNWDLFRELTVYYSFGRMVGKTDFSVTAGIFPRKQMKGEYSNAFFSDSLRFYDNNIEGLLLSFRRPSAYYEVGCDWMGMFGIDRRERFMIFSSGNAMLSDLFSIGYAAYLYHYAGARNVSGVVDNALLNPFAEMDFSVFAGDLQTLRLRLGWLQSMQNDRRNIGRYVFPHGGELTAEVRNWNVGLENYLFYGTGMMPYFRNEDAAGNMYGDLLYMGEPFYKVNMTGGLGFYDRVELYYEPHISDFLTLRASAVLHFNDWGFSGWQQKVSLCFNLQSLLRR